MSALVNELDISSVYSIAIFPVHPCDNIHIIRAKLVQGAVYRGKNVYMIRYFFGYYIHLLCTADRILVEYSFLPVSRHDSTALKQIFLLVPPSSRINADIGCTNYASEDMFKDTKNIDLMFQEKSNSRMKYILYVDYLLSSIRKRTESAISEIANLFPNKIHAVKSLGTY